MATPTLRQIAMLELIPRSPRKTYIKELKEKLADRGFEIDERSIQRDLVALERTLPLVCDARDKPYGLGQNQRRHSSSSHGSSRGIDYSS